MPLAEPGTDPLANFVGRAAHERCLRPIPLIATRIDVLIRGGLAVVTTERTFCNRETISIEALLTFPVPIDATLCALSARIGGRTLNAVAKARDAARETYEDAIGMGKTAVLHEELLRGIHMLSVAHLADGAEIMVRDTWTAPLTFVDSRPRLRIPTTVGEIYGRSPFQPSDDLVTADVPHRASIRIVCATGTASLLRAGTPNGGRFDIALDAPIDIVVDGWTQQRLKGIAADGRQMTLEIEPAATSDLRLDVDLLFDRSGSMSEPAAHDAEYARSKFEVANAGLVAAIQKLRSADRIRLWQFNDQASVVGDAEGAGDTALVQRLGSPGGGTEIGAALNAVIRSTTRRNVVIVTDGKSWALNAQTIAGSGLRLTAVLIGDDALEAEIADLAGITGGQVFVAAGSDASTAIVAALDAARMPYEPPAPIAGDPVRVETFRRGARMIATWGAETRRTPSNAARQVSATAAALAMPLMPRRAATRLAEAEGIVSHLTSLVLVDEAGVKHAGLPASRKVPLSTPRTASAMLCIDAPLLTNAAPRGVIQRLGGVAFSSGVKAEPVAPMAESVDDFRPAGTSLNLGNFVDRIDWDADPEALRRGDLSGQPLDAVLAVDEAAERQTIKALADMLGLTPVVVVIALMARASANRSAQRLAHALLGENPDPTLAMASWSLGLEAHRPSHRSA